jgi:hypothetical protein
MPLTDVAIRNAKPREKPYKGSFGAAVTGELDRLWQFDPESAYLFV